MNTATSYQQGAARMEATDWVSAAIVIGFLVWSLYMGFGPGDSTEKNDEWDWLE